ncbi:site-2 protease family protein [Streptosporangium roseum]|uniref:site-2 protease family protein n=1 Tax=Streptosporangium roseum TaxID=2001 RepID=UPI003330B066
MWPGDENRVFYRKKWWQKVIIMSGGPAMNFVLAFVFFTILLVGIGLPADAPTVSSATDTCVIPISEQRAACEPGDQLTPAAQGRTARPRSSARRAPGRLPHRQEQTPAPPRTPCAPTAAT